VDRHVTLARASDVYIRYRFESMALDSVRLYTETAPAAIGKPLIITHEWKENGLQKSAMRCIAPNATRYSYTIETGPAAHIENEALMIECP
jgi:hypothetical protein